MTNRHGGRPRMEGDRTPGGRLRPTTDLGTVEMQCQRAIALMPELEGKTTAQIVSQTMRVGAKDVALYSDRRASYPLGILAARGIVTGAMHFAGKKYLGLFVRATERTSGASVKSALASFDRGSSSGRVYTKPPEGFLYAPGEDPAEIAEHAYRAARRELFHRGQLCLSTVDNVVLHEHALQSEPLIRVLKIGLTILHEHFQALERVTA